MSWVKFQEEGQERPKYVTRDKVKTYLTDPDEEADAAARAALEAKVRKIRADEIKEQKRVQKMEEGRTKRSLRMWRTLALVSAVTLSAIIILTVVSMIREQRAYQEAIEEYDSLSNEVLAINEFHPSADNITEETESGPLKPPNLVIDYDRLRQINGDFIAWLYFPALDISYPIVQEDETNEYLKKTYGGQTNRAGAIYMDNVSDPSFNGLTDFIFGHNMANGTMFGKLRDLGKDGGGELIAEQPYIFIYTEERIIAYEIFAFFKTDVRSDVYNKVENDADYEKFLRIVLNYNQYEEARVMDFGERPEVLTLSTCSGSAGTKQRFLVSTMKLKEWEP